MPLGDLTQGVEAPHRRASSGDHRQGTGLEHVPIARGGKALSEPARVITQAFKLAPIAQGLHQLHHGAQPAQRDAQLVHAFGIAAILGGGHRLEQMPEAAAQNCGEALIQRHLRIKAELARLVGARRMA